jgi:aconitate hydratase
VAGSTLSVGDASYEIFRLDAVAVDVSRLPFTLRILLENVLRHGEETDVEALARWEPQAEPHDEISFRPARVLHQDFTGVPAIVDLAAMRAAMADLGGNPSAINPQLPSELVIDHSVQVDVYASSPSTATPSSSSSAIASGTPSSAGARAPSKACRSCHPRPASSTR